MGGKLLALVITISFIAGLGIGVAIGLISGAVILKSFMADVIEGGDVDINLEFNETAMVDYTLQKAQEEAQRQGSGT